MQRHLGPPVIVLALAFALAGCSNVRLVVTAVPADDSITETTVLDDGTGWRAAKVAQIDVTGLIADRRPRGVLAAGENPVDRFSEALERAENDDAIKAVIIRINSPGGTVTASDVLYREVEGFRQRTGKPVIALMADVAASGGYYLACAADEIIAHPTTITGSIGVIMQTISVADGMSRIGIHADAITSGPNKAMGSPLEPMTTEHRALLQGLVDEFYGSFRAMVIARRPGIPAGSIDEITDGRVVTGRRAVELGLADATGDLRDGFLRAKQLAGLSQARLVKYHRPTQYVGSAYAGAPIGDDANMLEISVGDVSMSGGVFWYVWDPAVWSPR